MTSTYISGPHPAVALAKGLYAGVKSRKGLHTPLPLTIYNDTEYVNAGFIDGFAIDILERLDADNLLLRIVHRGSLILSLFVLMQNGSIFHYSDHDVISSEPETCTTDIDIPALILHDKNARMLFFKISLGANELNKQGNSELIDWCFHGTIECPRNSEDPPLLISRSFGESIKLIRQYCRHFEHYAKLIDQYSDLILVDLPTLIVYESDLFAYEQSNKYIVQFSKIQPLIAKKIRLESNTYNLGGGGNMCLSVYNEIVQPANKPLFGMVDSDTIVPFKTLYLSSLLMSSLSNSCDHKSEVFTPTILHLKFPTTILESGCLFGRGNWNVISESPCEPCILPLEDKNDISNKEVQARVANSGRATDYPPFIFSLFKISNAKSIDSCLPSPFFLRGDDIELGIHLQDQGIPCKVLGSLVVFQDPKHSLWHELMAILHSVAIILAYVKKRNHIGTIENLSKYFMARINSHASIHDLQGLKLYTTVLERLVALGGISSEQRLDFFYDPTYYLDMRKLNANFTESNYSLLKALPSNLPTNSYLELPYLYFSTLSDSNQLPDKIGLLNNMSKTAAIICPRNVSEVTLKSILRKSFSVLNNFQENSISISNACQALMDRSLIKSHFLCKYSLNNRSERKK